MSMDDRRTAASPPDDVPRALPAMYYQDYSIHDRRQNDRVGNVD